METDIAQNITRIKFHIEQAANACKRDPNTIVLLAVSKKQNISAIQTAYQCGITHMGENYVQEAIPKILALHNEITRPPITWHFIGHIQRNKTKHIAEHFDWVHSIDHALIARRLAEQRPTHLPPLQVCIQLKLSREPSKSGIAIDSLESLISHIQTFPSLQLRGIMAHPEPSDDIATQKKDCQAYADIVHDLQKQYTTIDTLSMGTSLDFIAAIESGSTLLRLGTVLFGQRT
jgi:pyridoxal phosphate enzyme (YggS family)